MQKVILVFVDDDKAILRTLRRQVEQRRKRDGLSEVTIMTAENVAEARTLFSTIPTDVECVHLVTDGELPPDGDAFDVLTAAQSILADRLGYRAIHSGSIQFAPSAKKFGAQFFSKPLNTELLIATLCEYLK